VTPEEVAAIAAAAAQIQIAAAAVAETSASADLAAAAATPNSPPEVVPENTLPEEVVAENIVSENKENVPGQTFAAETHLPHADEKSDASQDVPMTMAAATQSMATESIAGANGGTSRWSAVAVALEAEEANIALDQEMQKAYAAFVTEETTSASVTPALVIAPPEMSAPAQVAEPAPTSAISQPEPEPVSQPEHFPSAEAPQPAPPQAEQSAPVAADSYVADQPASVPEVIPPPQPEVSFAEPAHESVTQPVTAAVETAAPQELTPVPQPEPAVAETIAESQAVAPIIPAEPAQEQERQKDEPKKESETETVDVKNTAAAWATWRNIRDTSDLKPADLEPQSQVSEAATPIDSAAMAVAAGAEQTSQENVPTPENPSDVASIVDSVLADLRPRLMAEITRKMSEKK
jgi:hypothetical protein